MHASTADDDDRWFGAWARSLRPRGLHTPCSGRGAAGRAEEIALVFRPDGSAEVRELLVALEGTRGTLDGARSPSGGALEIVARFRRADWARAAGDSRAAAALQAASDATLARPAPPRTMAIVNVTPDSFSDGGRYAEHERAIEHGLALAAEGADVLDVGGESTRPGSEPVEAEVELARIVPVVAALAKRSAARISVDTRKAAVARAALDAGASIVNDVSAGRADPAMLALVAERGAGFVAMHMQGSPRDMQRDPRYDDVVADVLDFLRERVRACLLAGIAREKIWIDPGIGFGKRLEHNLELLRRLSELRSLGLPLCLGVSRKSFLAKITGDEQGDRGAATLAAVTAGLLAGAEILRVHEVARSKEAAAVAAALRG